MEAPSQCGPCLVSFCTVSVLNSYCFVNFELGFSEQSPMAMTCVSYYGKDVYVSGTDTRGVCPLFFKIPLALGTRGSPQAQNSGRPMVKPA